MYFKKRQCPNCETKYDEMSDYCPHCMARNDENLEFKKRHAMSFLPWGRELALFLTGWIGLLGLQVIMTLFIPLFGSIDKVTSSMLINSLSYASLFLILFAIGTIPTWAYVRDIFSKFKIGWAYLFGAVGFIVLASMSFFSSFIIQLVRPGAGEGGNQTAIVELVKNFPLISIFIIGIIGPICEELTYRVGLFTLLRRVHPALAYIVTALLFGLIHFDYGSQDLVLEFLYLPNYIFAGVCFSFLYEKKGFATSTFAHVLNNLLSVCLIILTSSFGA